METTTTQYIDVHKKLGVVITLRLTPKLKEAMNKDLNAC